MHILFAYTYIITITTVYHGKGGNGCESIGTGSGFAHSDCVRMCIDLSGQYHDAGMWVSELYGRNQSGNNRDSRTAGRAGGAAALWDCGGVGTDKKSSI